MTEIELSKILFALKIVYGNKDGFELFEKLLKELFT